MSDEENWGSAELALAEVDGGSAMTNADHVQILLSRAQAVIDMRFDTEIDASHTDVEARSPRHTLEGSFEEHGPHRRDPKRDLGASSEGGCNQTKPMTSAAAEPTLLGKSTFPEATTAKDSDLGSVDLPDSTTRLEKASDSVPQRMLGPPACGDPSLIATRIWKKEVAVANAQLFYDQTVAGVHWLMSRVEAAQADVHAAERALSHIEVSRGAEIPISPPRGRETRAHLAKISTRRGRALAEALQLGVTPPKLPPGKFDDQAASKPLTEPPGLLRKPSKSWRNGIFR
jgi:hypothetical protein